MSTHSAYSAPGTVILGKYRVDHVLGSGGMGMVVAATHLQLQERVAVKFLLAEVLGSHEVAQRFVREAQAAGRLKGEHIARVIDVGVLPGDVPYMVMEYLDGEDLETIIAKRGPLAPAQAVDHVLQACEGLAEAHALGIIHRDVKPANLFVARRPDGSPLFKVLDFGISKVPVGTDAAFTRTLAAIGTPSYMSPEQMRSAREVDARTDIWALGVVLHECLSGRRPFEAETFGGLCLKVAMDPAPRLSIAGARGLDGVIARCLEKAPDDRFATVADLAAALEPYAGNARAAATIVERTRAMWSASVDVPSRATVRIDVESPTTLGQGAGVLDHRGPRNRAARLGTLGIAAAVVAMVTLTIGLRALHGSDEVAVAPARAQPAPGATAFDAGVPAAADAPPPPPVHAEAPVADATITPPPSPAPRPVHAPSAGASRPPRARERANASPSPECATDGFLAALAAVPIGGTPGDDRAQKALIRLRACHDAKRLDDRAFSQLQRQLVIRL
jgi:eukaryotic-like serine/threonine-protein kinase